MMNNESVFEKTTACKVLWGYVHPVDNSWIDYISSRRLYGLAKCKYTHFQTQSINVYIVFTSLEFCNQLPSVGTCYTAQEQVDRTLITSCWILFVHMYLYKSHRINKKKLAVPASHKLFKYRVIQKYPYKAHISIQYIKIFAVAT